MRVFHGNGNQKERETDRYSQRALVSLRNLDRTFEKKNIKDIFDFK